LAVTTETDFGVSMPVTAAAGGGAVAVAALDPLVHPGSEAVAIRVRRMHTENFM
jgi:hypothetical protein